MKAHWRLLLILISLAAMAVAQKDYKKGYKLLSTTEEDGLSVQRVALTAGNGEKTATFFIDHSSGPHYGMLITHSSIRNMYEEPKELRPFAEDLAKSGFAVLMINDELHWPAPGMEYVVQDHDAKENAIDYLLANANVSHDCFAIAGDESVNERSETRNFIWVPLEGPVNAESDINLPAGQAFMANWAKKRIVTCAETTRKATALLHTP